MNEHKRAQPTIIVGDNAGEATILDSRPAVEPRSAAVTANPAVSPTVIADINTEPPPRTAPPPVPHSGSLLRRGGGARTGSAASQSSQSSPSSQSSSQSSQPSWVSSVLPPPGSRIGHYELIRELGRGGMGAVFLARDIKLGRRVAIKFLQSGGQAELTQRFIREARVTAQVSHENIVVIHEVDEYEGNPYMVLEFLQGQPMSALLKDGNRIPPGRAVELMVPVVRALIRAHAHDIVHRDLKPDNIYLTDSGTVKVLDFGIAKMVQQRHHEKAQGPQALAARIAAIEDGGAELTRRGALVGTIPYMSPEQWLGQGVDAGSDIWAVGILLFKMLAGQHPLAPLRGQQLMVTAMLDQPMPSLRSVCPDVPENLVRVVDRCLRKAKGERYGTAQELLEALEPLLPGRFTRSLKVDESPYAGLSAFQESDADRFFGRTREIAALVTRLRDQPLIGVVGPSGVGKSSFVRAGVVPALKHSGESWQTVVIRPGRNPLAALSSVAASILDGSSSGVSDISGVSSVADEISEQHALMQRLRTEPGFLGTVLRSHARKRGQKILLFVDQFEELYTLIPDLHERLAFTACLAGVADDATTPLRVVLSIRSDFLDRVAEDQRFMADLGQGLYFLLPPGRDALREAIVMPAEMAGYHFESERMVAHMIDTLASTPGALPLLQFTATKLWEARDRSSKVLSEASYQAIGGTEGALASHADAVLNGLTPQAQGLVRAIFLRLVTPERTRAIVSVGELLELTQSPDEIQRLVDHLVQARLLVVQTGESQAGASVEIVHESLIHTWPRLRTWLDENQDDAAFLDQLRTAARQWHGKGRPGGLVWRGEAADEAQRWFRRYRGTLPMLEQEYLRAVFRLQRRSTVIRRTAVAVVMIGLILVAAGSTVALIRISQAEKEATAQAEAARAAEKTVRDQYGELELAMEKQKQAEAEAVQAYNQAQAANDQLQTANDEIMKGQEELVQALKRAERAKRKERRARRRAKANEAEAKQAAAEARAARSRVEALLRREQDRIAALQERLVGQGDSAGLLEDLK
ncbi:serine/threonine-protein kinase [Haliangium sp.]|uniref:serine/threonine-protein kinase n=1 Tax=Haliangium sp. TaxID=2663208 RepID=UPI003D0DF80F